MAVGLGNATPSRFHLLWKRSGRWLTSNFISLRSLHDSTQADTALMMSFAAGADICVHRGCGHGPRHPSGMETARRCRWAGTHKAATPRHPARTSHSAGHAGMCRRSHVAGAANRTGTINRRVTSRAEMFLWMTLHSARMHHSLPPHALLVMEFALTVHGVVAMEITVIAAQSVTVRMEMLHVPTITIRSVVPVMPVIVITPSEAVAVNEEYGFAAD
jgi:hypothetical protein